MFGLILTSALIILIAVTMDMGYIGVARSELKRAADATAISSCWELYDGYVDQLPVSTMESEVAWTAAEAAAYNTVNDESPTLSDTTDDVQLGFFDFATPDQFDTSDPSKFNAVRVTLRRQQEVNGEVPLFFGKLTGRNSQALQASATAAMVKTVSGFYTPSESTGNLQLLPIALDLETWQKVVAGDTDDDLCYVNGSVKTGSDGYFECNLYPQGTGSPGNRGTVDIGGANNSTADISRQILHGISAEDFAALGRPLKLDGNGEMELNGDTGISAAIKDELAAIVGQKRMIPIFSKVTGNGNNAMFTIVCFEGVRILGVKLTGPMKKKHLTVQPCPMVARGAIVTEPGTVESNYLFSPVMLVQ